MANDLTFFMRAAASEHQLLPTVERSIGVACDSQSFPNEAAPVYLVLMEYSEGFRLGVSLMWQPSFNPLFRIGELAQCLANEFQSDILFEAEDSISQTDQEHWLLATPGQKELRAVKIEVLSDGISLHEGS